MTEPPKEASNADAPTDVADLPAADSQGSTDAREAARAMIRATRPTTGKPSGEKHLMAYALIGALWPISTLAGAALLGAWAMQPRPTEAGLWFLLLWLPLMFLFLTGARARFQMGTDAQAQRLRQLSVLLTSVGTIAALAPFTTTLLRYGPDQAHGLLRSTLPSTMGVALTMTVLGSCVLLLGEAIRGRAELRGTARRPALALGLAVGIALSIWALGTLSGPITGRSFFSSPQAVPHAMQTATPSSRLAAMHVLGSGDAFQ